MKQPLVLLFALLSNCMGVAQHNYTIETADIERFWLAFDQLSTAHSTTDSIRIIQENYLDKASKSFKKFVRARNFTAQEYVEKIASYPQFWHSVRPLTLNIKTRKKEIDRVFEQFDKNLSHFKTPNVCFAIGCLRTGGTTSKNLILIGSEIAAADSTVNKTELTPWLKSVIGNTGDIVAMVAHETVHTQQRGFPLGEFFKLLKHRKLSLLNMSIMEGTADFMAMKFCGFNINTSLYHYGHKHECAIWRAFWKSYQSQPFDHALWLHNGNNARQHPADLGYFVGYQIANCYYESQTNKPNALRKLLRNGQYKAIFKESNYINRACQVN